MPSEHTVLQQVIWPKYNENITQAAKNNDKLLLAQNTSITQYKQIILNFQINFKSISQNRTVSQVKREY